jgi:hypothetical protein
MYACLFTITTHPWNVDNADSERRERLEDQQKAQELLRKKITLESDSDASSDDDGVEHTEGLSTNIYTLSH